MPLVNTTEMFKKAYEGGYAIGAFNVNNMEIVQGIMQAASEAGLRIPKDISLMGFDNISFSALPQIDLTTINQPTQQMAIAAVDMLLDHVNDPGTEHTKFIVPPSLVVRKSCRPPKK